jgi:hypothetical protein
MDDLTLDDAGSTPIRPIANMEYSFPMTFGRTYELNLSVIFP